jgi:hypothetical protein
MTPQTNGPKANPNRPEPEETLVPDPRAGKTPAQAVERKLLGLLSAVPVSALTGRDRPKRKGE